ncbi:YceI family protein [Blastomonas sp.]|uniref:YceI family protein n=1 Tax=Blastomonas sp. TaxID=1909299 RepID=UPI0035933995
MIRSFALVTALMLAACTPAQDQQAAPLSDGIWKLASDQSTIAFVSVKAGDVGEAHRFETVEGSVADDGAVTLTIDLASVQTDIDIRNERMRDMLFEVASFPDATLTAKIDPALIKNLKPGEAAALNVPVELNLHGARQSIDAKLSVTRIAPDAVQVQTVAPLIVDAAAFGMEGGIEKLRAVANLPAISTAVPVTASLVFRPQS